MKIVFTGGGSGGHFYPLMAIAEAVQTQIKEQNIVDTKLYYMADKPYDEEALFVNELEFVSVPTGKMRLYFSFENFTDAIKTFFGFWRALFKLIKIYPDVVVSKGGYPAVPVTLAAWFLQIPVMIHESDTAPGRANKLAAKFAKRIAVSFPGITELFGKPEITAWTGQPIRKDLWKVSEEGLHEYLDLDKNIPTLVIYGGSLGSQIINDAIMEILPGLIADTQIIHQTGVIHEKEIQERANFILSNNPYKKRYKTFGFFNELTLKMLGGGASLFITRGGAGSIFDMAMWKMPAIIIPITKSNGDHQRKNAYAYASTGAAHVIEEKNLEPHLLLAEIQRVLHEEGVLDSMKKSSEEFVRKDAADVIAKEVIKLALKHEI
jgi:UDP-N-acetylglucosamine--N-acetylmuramyl-(pentapeptide) pyrophosphoryl-undecaprenol N-acetylglucosamine transferase